MPFEFFGSRKKAVIGMAHIGALPGTPLYDAKGGMNRLVDGVLADVDRLQAGVSTQSCSATKTIARTSYRHLRKASLQ